MSSSDLLQLHVQWQLGVKLRRRSGALAGVGLAQSRQPRLGQIGAALRQPQLTFDQRDHCQIVDRRHVPDVHQAFGFGQFGKGLGELAAAAIQTRDHAMANQYADVATGPCLADPGQQAHACGLRLQAHRQQKTLVQGQPRAHRIQTLWRQAAQPFQPLMDFIECAQNFTACL